ncbi:hypothetical protein V7103_25185, partial [Neobacillus drentensis]|uniref:acyltransferase family protein n=1 Tax=Neobacillus drentensis TaxID=220684 RepID=UPI003042BF6E
FNYHVLMNSVVDFFRIYPFEHIVNEYAVVAGSILIIIISISSKVVQRFLLASPLRFLGKISYSLYLYHLPILFSLIYLFYKLIPFWLIVLIAFPLTIFFANFAWIYIEKPSIKFGKALISKIKDDPNKNIPTSKELSLK